MNQTHRIDRMKRTNVSLDSAWRQCWNVQTEVEVGEIRVSGPGGPG